MDVNKKVFDLLNSDKKQNKENMNLEQFINKHAIDLQQKKSESANNRYQIIKNIYIFCIPYFFLEI